MANITISYAELERSAAHLGQGREEIAGRLQALQQHIQQLVSSGFVTEHASIRFSQAYTEYTASATSVIARLTEIQLFLTQTATAIREMDAQLAARLA